MCPWYKVSTKQCRVSPASEEGSLQSEDKIKEDCTHHDNYRRCANLAAYERGDAKVYR